MNIYWYGFEEKHSYANIEVQVPHLDAQHKCSLCYGCWDEVIKGIPTKAEFEKIFEDARKNKYEVRQASKVFIELRFSCSNASGAEELFYVTYDAQQKKILVRKSDSTVVFSNLNDSPWKVESYRWLWGEVDHE